MCFWYLCLKWERGVHAFIKTCENDRLQVALGRGGERAMQYLSHWDGIDSIVAFGRKARFFTI